MKKCGYLYQQYSLPWQTGFCSSSLNQKEETICIFATFYNLIEIVRLTSKLANIAQMEKN